MSGKLLVVLTFILCAVSRPQAQTLDEVYKRALTEGGTLNFGTDDDEKNPGADAPASAGASTSRPAQASRSGRGGSAGES